MTKVKITREELEAFKAYGLRTLGIQQLIEQNARNGQDLWDRIIKKYNLSKLERWSVNEKTGIISNIGSDPNKK